MIRPLGELTATFRGGEWRIVRKLFHAGSVLLIFIGFFMVLQAFHRDCASTSSHWQYLCQLPFGDVVVL